PYLFVNRNTVMPSELSEAGFHTNPVQNQRNMNDRWKRLEALTFFWSVLKYRGIDRPFVGILTGIISDLETGVPINGATVTVNGRSDTTDSFESLFHRYSDDPDLLHNGVYFLENLPPDTLEVKVEAGDYYSRMLPVAVVDTFFTFVDVELISKVPPTVVSTRPVQGDTNIPAWNPVVFEFSRKMNRVSVETTLVVDPPAHRQFVWSEDDTEMRLEGDTLHFETAYTVTVSGDALDHWGHPFDGDGDGTGGDHFVLSFTTGPPDMSPPRIASAYPPLYATGVELNPIVSITFDEEVAAGSISDDKFRLERFSDGSVVPGILEHYVVRGRSVLSFFPSESLHPDEIYETTIYAGLKDLSGNEMTSAKAFSFRTSPDTWEITTIEDFESGVTSNWWQPSQSYHYFGTVPDSTGMGVSLSTVNLLSESSQSMRLNYGWDTGASEWLIREYLCCGAPRDLHFDDGYLLQVYIFGDGSGNLFRFSVDDRVPVSAAENHEVSPWYPVDWIGWRLVSWDMTRDGTGSWIGDGSLDGTLRFDSIQLTHSPGSDPFGVLYFDDLRLARVSTINVSEGPVLLPHRFVLHQNIPNPFNPVTEISYELPVRAYVRLSVYDVLGRLVRTLVNTVEGPGLRTVRWDGTGNDYQPVASGTYLIRLDARADRDGVQGEDHRRFIRTRRAVLLR
ncbi:MAG: Ig-like domain-containing protein, partial [Fidelibacterota bacterium]